MRFEWDPDKEAINRAKHGISFGDATALFTCGIDYLEIADDEHSNEEERLIAIGVIIKGVIVVIFTERSDDIIRILSVRKATKPEVRLYNNYLKGAQ
jgi:uncharacterized DUF497 family protein